MAKKAKASAKSLAKADRPTAKALDYDAVVTTGRRKAPRTKLSAEHIILPDSKRKKLLATIKDQIRNSSLSAWMIRRHLDYVTRFRVEFRHDSEDLTKAVNRLFDWHAQPRNFDISARFGREEMFRMFELEKVASGDAAMIKLESGHLQSIESDLIAFPKSGKTDRKTKQTAQLPEDVKDSVDKNCGVVLSDKYPNKIDQFCICTRGASANQLEFDHLEDADNVIFDGYWTRFSSQIRGVSPLSTVVSMVQDAYENFDYALAKAKVHQIFGLALMRDYAGATDDQEEVYNMGGASGITTGTEEAAEDAAATDNGTKSISAAMQEIKPSEMMMIDMDAKGRIDTIESKTPSAEFQNFLDAVTRWILLALDIPFSAFNSKAASFSGLIADQNMYEVSCKWKREKNLWARKDYSDWLIEQHWDSEVYRLKELSGRAGIKTPDELKNLIEWIPSGSPWLQKLAEVQGDSKAIAIALDNPIDAAKRRGSDVFENIDKTAKVYEYAKSKGVTLMVGDPGQSSVEEKEAATQDAPENEDKDNE